jgi:AraC-like DNA-binding protein
LNVRHEHYWDTQKIVRLPTSLSADRPILCHTNLYKTKTTSFFDMHYGLELGLVLSGKMRRFYQGQKTDLNRGEPWLCGMWEPHGFEVIQAPCEIIVMTIWPPMLATLRFDEAPTLNWLGAFTLSPEKRIKLDSRTRNRLFEIGRDINTLCLAHDEASKLRIRFRLMDILLLLNEKWNVLAQNKNNSSDALTKINHILQMVFESKNIVTAQEAARICGMNRNAFAAFFKDLMGISFPDFALRYRLQSVASQLLNTDIPIKALASEWGFTDASHLHRCFCVHYQCSPAEYRKRHHIQ